MRLCYSAQFKPRGLKAYRASFNLSPSLLCATLLFSVIQTLRFEGLPRISSPIAIVTLCNFCVDVIQTRRFDGILRIFALLSVATTAATAAACAVVVVAVTATVITIARKEKCRDDDYPNKAFVIEKIANAVHKISSCIYKKVKFI